MTLRGCLVLGTTLLNELFELRFETRIKLESFFKILICTRAVSLQALDHGPIGISLRIVRIEFDCF
jgi:hypothetical protein